MKEKKNWLGKVILLIVVIAAVAVYFLVPGVNKMMNKVFAMFASGDFTVVRDFVASYGAYAAVISFLLMIFQSIAAPLPAFLLTFANANLFGWWQPSASIYFVRYCKLCGRTDIYVIYVILYCNRNRTASGNNCVLLRWRHVDRRCKVICDRAYDFVCPLGTDLYAEKNIYGPAVQKRKREDMKWILTTIRKIWRSLEPLGKKHQS